VWYIFCKEELAIPDNRDSSHSTISDNVVTIRFEPLKTNEKVLKSLIKKQQKTNKKTNKQKNSNNL